MITLYWIGVVVLILLGLISLTYSDDEDCNIPIPKYTLFAVPIFGLFSWAGIFIIALVVFREKVLKVKE